MKKKVKGKQIAAIGCIVILIGLYLVTLIAAIFDFEGADRLFAACIGSTIGLPILLWIYIWMYGKLTGKKTIADGDIKVSENQEEMGKEEHDA